MGDCGVVSLEGNQVEIWPTVGGLMGMEHIKHIKYILPMDGYMDQLPDCSGFGGKVVLRFGPDQVPDLHWRLANAYHAASIGQMEKENTSMSIHDMTAEAFDGVGGTSLDTETCTTQSICVSIVCSVIPNAKNQ